MIVVVFLLLSGVTLIGLTGAGIGYSSANLKPSYNMLKCSVFLLIDESLYGTVQKYSTASSWIGAITVVDSAKTAIKEIKGQQQSFDNIANKPIGSNSYSYSLNSLNTIANKYDSSASSVYTVTNPGDGNPGYILEIRTNWKSYTDSKSFSNPIHLQRNLFQTTIYNSMSNLVAAAKNAMSGSTFTQAENSLNSINLADPIKKVNDKLKDYLKKADDQIDRVVLGFALFYAIIMICSIMMILGTVGFAFCSCLKCRCLIHTGWIIMGLLMIIGFGLSMVTVPVFVVLTDVCGILPISTVVTVGQAIAGKDWDYINVCLTGDGDLYKKYDLASKLDFIKDISNAIELVGSIYDQPTDSLKKNITDAYVVQVILFYRFIYRLLYIEIQHQIKLLLRNSLMISLCKMQIQIVKVIRLFGLKTTAVEQQ